MKKLSRLFFNVKVEIEKIIEMMEACFNYGMYLKGFNLHMVSEKEGYSFINSSMLLKASTSLNPTVIVVPTPVVDNAGIIYLPDHEEWELFSINAQNFMIEHEKGHIKKKHVFDKKTNKRRVAAIKQNKVVEEELEADYEGALVVGFANAILALEELKDFIPKEAVKEVNMRINALKPFVEA